MKHHHCIYCQATVSPKADHCPHCGEPDPARKELEIIPKSFRLIGTIALLISGMYWGCGIDLLNTQPFFHLLISGSGFILLLKSIRLA